MTTNNAPSNMQIYSLAAKLEAHGNPWQDAEYRFSDKDILDFSYALLAKYGQPITKPNEWKLAIDNELVSMGQTADDYLTPTAALAAAIEWNVQAATDPVLKPAKSVPCQDPAMNDFGCKDKAQCWEPCGELGHSLEHAEPVKAVQHSTYVTPLAWINEADLPADYPYDALYPYSEMYNGKRRFPIYGPHSGLQQPEENHD